MMESLAYIHAAIDYEDPSPVPELRSIEEITSAIPSSTLMGVARAAIAVGVLAHAPEADASLRRGNVCSAVTILQSTLRSKGYSVGGVDGAFGNNTEFAVKQFQSKNGLSRDGIVGSATASRMGLNPNISCGNSGGIGGGTPPGDSGSGGVGDSVRVTARSGLNIRSAPSTSSSVIGSLANGSIVSLTGYGDNGFVQLRSGGFIAARYTTPAGGSSGGSGGVGGGSSESSVVVAGNSLRIRSGPGTDYRQIGGLGYGQRVRLTGERVSRTGYTWAKLSGQSGWVATSGLN